MNPATINRVVLVADDTADIRELVRFQLMTLGCRVLEAANGQEAINVVGREFPEFVLMDLSMPVLDGLEATRLIRESGEHNLVIVAFTAFRSAENRERATAAGCNDYVEKPLATSDLRALLQRHFA